MKTSSDYRSIARNALRGGRWGLAIGVSFVAGLLSGSTASGGYNTLSSQGSGGVIDYNTIGGNGMGAGMGGFISFFLAYLLVTMIIGGAIDLGHNYFYINMIYNREVKFSNLFDRFNIIWRALGLRLYMGILIFLWTLLLIIPGIIAAYRYSMAPFIMAENPEIGIMDAVERSKSIMYGNKARLFFLEISFIGWSFLCIFTLGIGFFWLTPYMHAARTAFYLDVSMNSTPEYANTL